MESSRDLIPEYVYSRQAEFENSEVYSRTTADRRLFLREISPEEGDAHDVQRLLSGGPGLLHGPIQRQSAGDYYLYSGASALRTHSEPAGGAVISGRSAGIWPTSFHMLF